MNIKNGIAYSGDNIECGNSEEKIKHAIKNDINYIQRGYEAFDEKLRSLGADIIKEDYNEEMRADKIG